ncbi:hypothetical protein ACSQ67_016010 [Phaseolus vulgaris]
MLCKSLQNSGCFGGTTPCNYGALLESVIVGFGFDSAGAKLLCVFPLPFFSGLEFSAFSVEPVLQYGPCMKKEGIDTFPSKEILYCFCEIHSVGKLGGVKLEFQYSL